jgi:hypothetical protein
MGWQPASWFPRWAAWEDEPLPAMSRGNQPRSQHLGWLQGTREFRPGFTKPVVAAISGQDVWQPHQTRQDVVCRGAGSVELAV